MLTTLLILAAVTLLVVVPNEILLWQSPNLPDPPADEPKSGSSVQSEAK